ncbi:hypothetical protein GC098_06750 [Paenibacillus sp. LMG 31458]|uniref:PH domain-containing protein n=2 Tax=Paenibacillus phytorum TaxID=2654977 RepID=A0ABX1XRT9_9BACL|nr:hypothetical protein [Paenibacillus phytorum]
MDDDRSGSFTLSLQQEGSHQAKIWLADLTSDIRKRPDTLVSYTKGIYLQLYQTVQQIGKESGIPAFKQEMALGTYVERLYACQTLEELQLLLSGELEILFDYLESRRGNSIIRRITSSEIIGIANSP